MNDFGDARVAGPALRAFTADEYHRMGAVGILSEDDRVELIEGMIVAMAPIGAPHAAVTYILENMLKIALGRRAIVFVQNPIRLNPACEPQPDISVLKPTPRRYRRELPGPDDALLLVEVADTSLAHDRDVKGPLYARHGIAEYWIVDLTVEEILVHREPIPAEGRYRSVEHFGRDQILAMTAFPDVRIAVSELFSDPPD